MDQKPDIHLTLESKKAQEVFDQNIETLKTRVNNINEQVIDLNRTLNQRNNSIVQDITQIIHEVLHDAEELSNELLELKEGSKLLTEESGKP